MMYEQSLGKGTCSMGVSTSWNVIMQNFGFRQDTDKAPQYHTYRTGTNAKQFQCTL